MPIEVVPYRDEWPQQFEAVARSLRAALRHVPGARVEHVGSTAVPGLPAKPVLDVDVLVDAAHVAAAVEALEAVGYVHRGDLGVTGREAFGAPDDAPRRHVYVCDEDTLHVRNHLAVRDVLRRRADLREAYGAVKQQLARDPGLTMEDYLRGKTDVLQRVLEASGVISGTERDEIAALNRGDG